MIYFDNAASAPVEPDVIRLIDKLLRENYGNPSSIHEHGRSARVVIENSRKSISKLLGVSPSEIFFTSGGTEANNLILWSCAIDLKISDFITSPIEHPSVLATLENLSKHFKINLKFVDIDSKGNIDLEHLNFLLEKSRQSIVSLMHANNETGNLLAVKQVKNICQKHKALFHSDTVQTTGKFRMDFKSLGFDFAASSAHKFHGPKGVGFIYISSDKQIKPIITGGSQERNMRAGTENIYGIAGMALALEIAVNDVEKNQTYITGLKNYLIDKLKKEFPVIGFYGDSENTGLYTILNLKLPDNDKSELIQNNLDIEKISVSGGSACSSGSTKASHVITAIEPNTKNPSLRISLGKQNRIQEIDMFIDVLKKIYF